jgi:hypothetical protein
MYANTCWGLLGLSVTFGLAVLGLPTQYEWLSPWFLGAAVACGVGSLICFGWPLRQRENRAKVAIVLTHPARAVRLIEPSHVIILGLVIAAIGIVWQMRTAPPNGRLGTNKPLTWVFSGMAGKSDADGFRVGDIQIWSAKNDTGKAVRLIDAYIQSDIDGGKKRPLLLNTYEHGLIPLNQANPIPPDTENITLMAQFPNLSEADFMRDWGKVSFVIQDSDHTVQGKIEEQTFKTVFDGYRPRAPAARPTKIKTNPYDIPKKLAAIDEILPLLRDERLVNRGLQLQSNWRNFLTADRQKYMTELTQYRVEWQAFAQKLADLRAANQNYEDITSLLNQEYQKAYTDSFSRFQGAIGSIGDPPYKMDLNFFIQPIAQQFSEGINGMAVWRGQTATKFAQLRKEITEGQ